MSRICNVPGCGCPVETPAGLCFEHWKAVVLDEARPNPERLIIAPSRLAPYQTSAVEMEFTSTLTDEQREQRIAEGWTFVYSTQFEERWQRIVKIN